MLLDKVKLENACVEVNSNSPVQLAVRLLLAGRRDVSEVKKCSPLPEFCILTLDAKIKLKKIRRSYKQVWELVAVQLRWKGRGRTAL